MSGQPAPDTQHCGGLTPIIMRKRNGEGEGGEGVVYTHEVAHLHRNLNLNGLCARKASYSHRNTRQRGAN